jgi:hypothetical protein
MRVPDRQKQRREYLKKKAGISIKWLGISLMSVCLAGATIVCFLATMCFLLLSLSHVENLLDLATIAAALTAGSGYGFVKSFQFISELDTNVPNIQPVTTAYLPAEEVLVRGSQEPIQEQSAVLLRAAGEGDEVPAEELLRASTGEKRKSSPG